MTFVLFFLIIFFAFTIAGHLVYGPSLYSFSDFGQAILETLRGVFGQFNYDDMNGIQRYITPIVSSFSSLFKIHFHSHFILLHTQYFVLFMLIMIFVLLNSFVLLLFHIFFLSHKKNHSVCCHHQ